LFEPGALLVEEYASSLLEFGSYLLEFFTFLSRNGQLEFSFGHLEYWRVEQILRFLDDDVAV